MDSGPGDWRAFLRSHRGAFAAFILFAALLVVDAVYVFVWFAGMAQSSGLVPRVLGTWSMSNLAAFIVNAAFWEIVLVGIPAIVAVILVWRWWSHLPNWGMGWRWGGRARTARGGGGVGLAFFLGFCLKVYLDGNWTVPVSGFTLDYVVGAMLTVLLWGLVVLGIPALIALAWWLNREMKNP